MRYVLAVKHLWCWNSSRKNNLVLAYVFKNNKSVIIDVSITKEKKITKKIIKKDQKDTFQC